MYKHSTADTINLVLCSLPLASLIVALIVVSCTRKPSTPPLRPAAIQDTTLHGRAYGWSMSDLWR